MQEDQRSPAREPDAQYETMISETMEEELHRMGASSDMIDCYKESREMPMPGNLDRSVRVRALRCMFKMLVDTLGEGACFQAALLLDRVTASNSFRLEQLPLTCVCLTRLMLKCAFGMAMVPGEDSPSMSWIKDFATWLTATQNLVTSEGSTMSRHELALHELRLLKALDCQVELPCAEKWCLLYFTRFGHLGREFQAPVQQMQAKALLSARAVVMCFPASPMLSHGKLAAGLFSLSFVYSGLLPMASLQPSNMDASEWSALFAAITPNELPACRLPHSVTKRLMDLICLTMKEEPDDIRAWTKQVLETLGETCRQVREEEDGARNS
ncbi:KCNQ2 [Symbiodinium natans]|uniref:KCNQ2 protein n=1 Tax=Symbiodinium natans TaxID=878477 RepID=A0A812U2J0_9DINO|nr:KCNQ2 [Symbiodinium natans]